MTIRWSQYVHIKVERQLKDNWRRKAEVVDISKHRKALICYLRHLSEMLAENTHCCMCLQNIKVNYYSKSCFRIQGHASTGPSNPPPPPPPPTHTFTLTDTVFNLVWLLLMILSSLTQDPTWIIWTEIHLDPEILAFNLYLSTEGWLSRLDPLQQPLV